MNSETPAELLQQLLDACNEGTQGAIHLAELTEIEDLRALLEESAQQYRRAADELRTVCTGNGTVAEVDHRRDAEADIAPDGDALAFWERAECNALTYFRDAYDTPLPPLVSAAVKRHFEAGIERLERLRKMQTRTGPGPATQASASTASRVTGDTGLTR